MDALRGRLRVKYSKRNARIEIPYHVLERLISRDLRLQQIEDEGVNSQHETSPPIVTVDAEYNSGIQSELCIIPTVPGKISMIEKKRNSLHLRKICVRVNATKYFFELLG